MIVLFHWVIFRFQLNFPRQKEKTGRWSWLTHAFHNSWNLPKKQLELATKKTKNKILKLAAWIKFSEVFPLHRHSHHTVNDVEIQLSTMKPWLKIRIVSISTSVRPNSEAILLMVQKSGDHQLRLVVYPPLFFVYRFYIPGGDRRMSSIESSASLFENTRPWNPRSSHLAVWNLYLWYLHRHPESQVEQLEHQR